LVAEDCVVLKNPPVKESPGNTGVTVQKCMSLQGAGGLGCVHSEFCRRSWRWWLLVLWMLGCPQIECSVS